MRNKARIYSIKQGLSRLEHDFHTIVVRFQVQSITVCNGIVRLNTTFTRLTGHLQGLHTSHRLLFEFDSMRFIYDINTWSGLHVRLYIRSLAVLYGLTRFLRSCTIANTIIHGHGPVSVFKKF